MLADLLRRKIAVADSGDPLFSGVRLLLPFDGTNGSISFADSGPNALTISRTGTPTISTAQSKFGGSSGSFNGSSYISAAASSLFSVGTGDFTVETWIYFNSIPTGTSVAPICQSDAVGVSSNTKWWFGYQSSTLRFGQHFTSNAAYCSWTPSAGVWYHVAVQRKSGTVSMYINGVLQTVTNSTIFSATSFSQNGFVIGAVSTPYYLNGYLDDFRFTVPAARYSTGFTSLTKAYATFESSNPSDPSFSYNSILLHFDGVNGSTSFTDNGPNALTVTRTGSPTISTAQSKYGGASAAFSGSTDRLEVASNALFAFGTGDFTVEFWAYFNSVTTAQTSLVNVNISGGFSLYWAGSAGYYGVFSSLVVSNRQANKLVSAWSPSANTWYHVAVTRAGTSLKLFINGTQLGSATDSTSYAQGVLQLGGSSDGTGWTINGNIDDLEIKRGFAKYTSNFTPPTKALPDLYNPYTTLPVSGAALWLDASQQNTLFTDAGVNAVTKSGDLVYQWNDLSGNNRHATQATSGNRPTWSPPASGRNGFGAVTFTGTQWLGFTNTFSSFTIFVIYKNTDTTNGSVLIGKSTGTSNYLFASTVSRIEMNGGSTQQVNDARTNGTQWDYSTYKYDGSTVTAYSSGSTGTSNAVGSTSFSPDRIGYYSTAAYALEGSIAEIIVYPTALSDSDRTTVVNYIKAKWGF